jgi:hypothetical protein
MISNRKEWQMSHLSSLIIHEETIKKLSELAEQVYRLERANGIEQLETVIMGWGEIHALA